MYVPVRLRLPAGLSLMPACDRCRPFMPAIDVWVRAPRAVWRCFEKPDLRMPEVQLGIKARPAGMQPPPNEAPGQRPAGNDGVADGVTVGQRQRTVQAFEASRLVMSDDVRNFLARLHMPQYERVFQDWGFTGV